MNANVLTRQVHRWVSMAFVAIVAAIFIAQWQVGELAQWLYLLPLLPLAILALTGLYLFVLPYRSRARAHSGRGG
jgi:ABC-type polysaccharide/polyol phosphate export permease